MKRKTCIVLALMISLCLLCSCGGVRDLERVTQLRENLARSQEISIEADITAQGGRRVTKYSLRYTQQGEDGRIEVLAPELIAGVSASVRPDGTSLEYDGLILETGKLGDDGLTPISCLPVALHSMKAGHLEGVWRESEDEQEYVVAEITVSDSSRQLVWLDADSLIPMRMEISSGGQTLICCEITAWSA